MIKKRIDEITVDEILKFEEEQVENIKSIARPYEHKFREYNIDLEYEFYRIDKKRNEIYNLQKNDLKRGYNSGVNIYIRRDGYDLSYDDGEDGICFVYTGIDCIWGGLIKPYIFMCDDHSHILSELEEYLDDFRNGVKVIKAEY